MLAGLQPRIGHDDHDERAKGEDDLHHVDGSRSHIQSAEGLCRLCQQGDARRQCYQQGAGDGRQTVEFLLALVHTEVYHKYC